MLTVFGIQVVLVGVLVAILIEVLARGLTLAAEDGDGTTYRSTSGPREPDAVAHVVLTRNLTQFTGGESELELDAGNIRQLLRLLGARYPALEPHLGEGLAVAIDGEIFQDAWLEPIPPGSEVHIIPRIAGG